MADSEEEAVADVVEFSANQQKVALEVIAQRFMPKEEYDNKLQLVNLENRDLLEALEWADFGIREVPNFDGVPWVVVVDKSHSSDETDESRKMVAEVSVDFGKTHWYSVAVKNICAALLESSDTEWGLTREWILENKDTLCGGRGKKDDDIHALLALCERRKWLKCDRSGKYTFGIAGVAELHDSLDKAGFPECLICLGFAVESYHECQHCEKRIHEFCQERVQTCPHCQQAWGGN